MKTEIKPKKMAKLTLKDIVETEGFSRAFNEMCKYTLKYSKEAELILSNQKNTYLVTFGSRETTWRDYELPPEETLPKVFNKRGLMVRPPANVEGIRKHDMGTLFLHTHPNENPIDLESGLSPRLSEVDLECGLSYPKSIHGIVAPHKHKKDFATMFIYLPFRYDGDNGSYTKEIIKKWGIKRREHVFHLTPTGMKHGKFREHQLSCIGGLNPKYQEDVLKDVGLSDHILLKRKKGFWQPTKDGMKKLENY